MSAPPAVLFMCLGNICRSPIAEGVARAESARRGLDWRLDSCGTGAWHVGEPPDPRSVAVARRHGVDIAAQRARQLAASDFADFDWIVAMDRSCLDTAQRRAPRAARARLVPFMPFVPDAPEPDVPDPYYGGPEGFQRVWDLLHAGMPRLFDAVLAEVTRR
ncbi:MAG: low molecular weight phosphotyrosine protein phosphatase [Deltaproteobacteria bacterium]|nr:low molecular weight phosphotyrosine protein phosphatase [Deltaproteobacteria bacterium]